MTQYNIEDRVQWSDWDDEPNKTGMVVEVDRSCDYYNILVDGRSAIDPRMMAGLPGKSIIGLVDPLPDNVIQFRRKL